MTPFFEKILRAGGKIPTALARFRKRAGLLFLSTPEKATRASGSVETLKLQAVEAERLDRLRNPRNYQGR